MDDVKLNHKGHNKVTTKELQLLASKEAQSWSKLLWVTGGKINFLPKKCILPSLNGRSPEIENPSYPPKWNTNQKLENCLNTDK